MSSTESEDESSEEETEYVTCHSSESGCVTMDTSDENKKKDEKNDDEKQKEEEKEKDEDGEKADFDKADEASADEPLPDKDLDSAAEEPLLDPEPAANNEDAEDGVAAGSSEWETCGSAESDCVTVDSNDEPAADREANEDEGILPNDEENYDDGEAADDEEEFEDDVEKALTPDSLKRQTAEEEQ